MSDPIRNPAHYTVYPVQPIEIARHLGFCMGNVFKYVMRAPFKNGVEDCDKALRYLEWEVERQRSPVSRRVYGEIEDHLEVLINWMHNQPGTPHECAIRDAQRDILDCLHSYLLWGMVSPLMVMRSYICKLSASITMRHCRVCGCIDRHACEGGCHWVAADLCSACVGKEGEQS